MHSEGYGTWSCLSVCLFVHASCRITVYEAPNERYPERYQQFQGYEIKKSEKAYFPETTAFQRYGVKMHLRECSVPIAHAPPPAGYAGAHASCQFSMRIRHMVVC